MIGKHVECTPTEWFQQTFAYLKCYRMFLDHIQGFQNTNSTSPQNTPPYCRGVKVYVCRYLLEFVYFSWSIQFWGVVFICFGKHYLQRRPIYRGHYNFFFRKGTFSFYGLSTKSRYLLIIGDVIGLPQKKYKYEDFVKKCLAKNYV